MQNFIVIIYFSQEIFVSAYNLSSEELIFKEITNELDFLSLKSYITLVRRPEIEFLSLFSPYFILNEIFIQLFIKKLVRKKI